MYTNDLVLLLIMGLTQLDKILMYRCGEGLSVWRRCDVRLFTSITK